SRICQQRTTGSPSCSYVHHLCFLFLSFFFFQAEDGIRDLYVTGVQTCALPILEGSMQPQGDDVRRTLVAVIGGVRDELIVERDKIGRASCRERVDIRGFREQLKKNSRGRAPRRGVAGAATDAADNDRGVILTDV